MHKVKLDMKHQALEIYIMYVDMMARYEDKGQGTRVLMTI